LLCATVATLVFVPTVFALVHGARLTRSRKAAQDEPQHG
jgi:hypothetical protein